jgi:hypothetical protein
VSASHDGVRVINQPGWIADDGVQIGQASTGGVWSLTFNELGTLDQFHMNATLTLTIDSYSVQVQLTSGMDHIAAAQAVQQAMVTAGFLDAHVDGNGVLTFNTDPNGATARSLGFSFDASGDPTGDGEGLYLVIGIAQRQV